MIFPLGTAQVRSTLAPMGVMSLPVPWKSSPAAASCICRRASSMGMVSAPASRVLS